MYKGEKGGILGRMTAPGSAGRERRERDGREEGEGVGNSDLRCMGTVRSRWMKRVREREK